MKSLQGHLLIASPEVTDPDLARTVIFLIQHSAEQAVGVVWNRPTDTTVKQLWKTQMKKPCDFAGLVYSGGPVLGPIMAVHDQASSADLEVMPGAYYTVKKKHLHDLVRQTDICLRFFDGHAGWGPGQLETQLDRGSWQVATTDAERLFAQTPDDPWKTLVKET